jgi:hypothetical protein
MNPHLATALTLYESKDIDLQRLIGWHLSYGIVLSTPKFFALCFHSHSEDPGTPVAFEHSDTLYVTMWSGDMRNGLAFLKDDYEYISFCRDFKGSSRTRLMNTEKLFSKLR